MAIEDVSQRAARPPVTRGAGAESNVDLLAGLVADASDLAMGHLDRLQHEVKQEIGTLKSMSVRWLIVLGLAIVGAMHVTLAATLALAQVTGWAPWLCHGFVATLVLLVAGVAAKFRNGKQKS